MPKVTLNYIQEIIENKKVVFWGASLFLEKILKDAEYVLPNVIGIIDNNPQKQGKDFYGYKIVSKDILNSHENIFVLMTISASNINQYKHVHEEVLKFPNASLLPNIFVTKYSNAELQNLELIEAQIFNNLINNSHWCLKRDFIPLKAAASYSLLNILFIILENFKPQNILELGLGQTTKLTSQYVQNKNQNANVQIIEHDKEWIEYFSSQIEKSSNVQLIKKDLCEIEINGTFNEKYENLLDTTKDKKYDLIIIDGPISKDFKYPRSNIVELIPQNLAEDFIIILDDTNRDGEKNTARLIRKAFKDAGIKYYETTRFGIKGQFIFASESRKFVTIY